MSENVRRYLRQKTGSIGTLIALATLAVLAGLPLSAGQPAGFTATLAVLVMGAGIVARDASSGALQMILTRPVLRVEYLLGRFFGAVVLFAVFVGSAVVVGFLIDAAGRAAGWQSGGPDFSWEAALRSGLVDFLRGVLVVATLLFLSTFLRGLGDVLAFVLGALALNLLPQIGANLRRPELGRFGRALLQNVSPAAPVDEILRGRVLVGTLSAYVLALVGFVLLACLVFNRREFSYGTD
jgi:ABC-type transport system involved in multi-copper enzyme maturation permease subunit